MEMLSRTDAEGGSVSGPSPDAELPRAAAGRSADRARVRARHRHPGARSRCTSTRSRSPRCISCSRPPSARPLRRRPRHGAGGFGGECPQTTVGGIRNGGPGGRDMDEGSLSRRALATRPARDPALPPRRRGPAPPARGLPARSRRYSPAGRSGSSLQALGGPRAPTSSSAPGPAASDGRALLAWARDAGLAELARAPRALAERLRLVRVVRRAPPARLRRRHGGTPRPALRLPGAAGRGRRRPVEVPTTRSTQSLRARRGARGALRVAARPEGDRGRRASARRPPALRRDLLRGRDARAQIRPRSAPRDPATATGGDRRDCSSRSAAGGRRAPRPGGRGAP